MLDGRSILGLPSPSFYDTAPGTAARQKNDHPTATTHIEINAHILIFHTRLRFVMYHLDDRTRPKQFLTTKQSAGRPFDPSGNPAVSAETRGFPSLPHDRFGVDLSIAFASPAPPYLTNPKPVPNHTFCNKLPSILFVCFSGS